MKTLQFYKCAYCDTTTEIKELFIGIDFSLNRIYVCKRHKDKAAVLLDTEGDWKPMTMPKGAIIGKAGSV